MFLPMILSGREIEKRLNKTIFIEPYTSAQLNPNSYNLRLHNKLLEYNDLELDMKKENKGTK
jgi:dCTP deaminase